MSGKDHRSCGKQVFGAPSARFACASVAPYLTKFGKPSIREILVITWRYASTSVQTLREGERESRVSPSGGGVCYSGSTSAFRRYIMRNAALAPIKVKISGVENKSQEEHTTFARRKGKLGWFWKFHVVVEQNNDKEMYRKGVLHVQSCFFAYETNWFLGGDFCCRCLFALHNFIFCLSKL